MMKTVKILLILVILLISGFVSYILFKSLMKEDITVKEEITQEESVSGDVEDFSVKLSLEQNGFSYLNETGIISLKIDTMIYEIPGLDVKITYSPELLEIESIDNGDLENYLVKDIDKENGVITISATNGPESLFKGTGVVANFNVRYLEVGTTVLEFDENVQDTNVPLVGGVSADLELNSLNVYIVERSDEELEVDFELGMMERGER